MNDNISLYINELKNKIVPRYKLIGISSQCILAFSLFKSNSDLPPFLNIVFNLEFKPYVYRSRTIIVAKTVRYISNCGVAELDLIKKNLYRYLTESLKKDEQIGQVITKRGAKGKTRN